MIGIDYIKQHIIAFTDKELFHSKDNGDTWIISDILQNTKMIKISPSYSIYALSNKELYVMSKEKVYKLSVPLNNILGIKIVNNALIAYLLFIRSSNIPCIILHSVFALLLKITDPSSINIKSLFLL